MTRVAQQIGDYVGVMFVSANAVDHFFASTESVAALWGPRSAIRSRAWATGPGTANALSRAGVAPQRLDVPPADAAQFDSEALWQVVGPQVHAGERVLIVRGADEADAGQTAAGSGRDWFARQVLACGAQAEFVVAYQRRAPVFSLSQSELARNAASDGSIWLFSSAQAVRNLLVSLPGQSWLQARAIATHARIASSARAAGFGAVLESRPTLSDVVAALESWDEPRS